VCLFCITAPNLQRQHYKDTQVTFPGFILTLPFTQMTSKLYCVTHLNPAACTLADSPSKELKHFVGAKYYCPCGFADSN